MKANLLSFKSGKNLGMEPAASFPMVLPFPTTTTTQEGPVTRFPTNINSCFTKLLVSEILRSTAESIIGQRYLRMIVRLLTGTKCQVVLNLSHVSAGHRQGPHLLTLCTFSQNSWNVPTSWLTLSELVTST